MSELKVNGIRIVYEWHGPEDADVLILSNGILMSTVGWAYQARYLSKHYRLLLYDCRGMWASEHPPGPYSMALHADDLAALMDGLGVEKAYIGGTSYGAEISMVFALRYPERVRKLIITSAVSQIDPVLAGFGRAWLMAAEMGDPEFFFRLVYPLTFSDAWIAANRPVLEEARKRYRDIDFKAMAELIRSFLALDITADLPGIKAPTLVIVGEQDLLKPRRYSEIITSQIPDAQLAVIPDAGHAALWERHDLFNALILGFLAG